VLSTEDPERLYSGLSVLVSTAVDGAECAALVSFGALRLMLDPDLEGRARAAVESELFARSLVELVATARGLETLRLYACSASVETMGLSAGEVESGLDGVMSTPRFLREAGDARLIFV
jgi:peroxiredoxin family protein